MRLLGALALIDTESRDWKLLGTIHLLSALEEKNVLTRAVGVVS